MAELDALARRISYAQCWEDPGVLVPALAPEPGDHVLSIASAGDNSLALALAGAERVTALDLSEPQLHLLALKLAGGHLPYEEFLQLLGLLPDGRRVFLYHRAREFLSDDARRYWDAHEEVIRTGLLSSGKIERYLASFRTRVLPLVHSRSEIDALRVLEDPAVQRDFYDGVWDNRRWRALFRVFFSRAVMQRLGRDPAQFAQVKGSVAERLLTRAEWVLTTLSIADNPFLQWILTGTYADLQRTHPYLSRAGHSQLAELSERFTLVHATLEEHLASVPAGTYSAFNYSNLFEYVPEAAHTEMLRLTAQAGRPGARVVYWNLFVPRSRPESLADRRVPDSARAAALYDTDRAFFYSAFRLEVVQ
jgi:S-adenosylmethionine-diacylglycerol 3-amino-3-carboxypropyl transferase